MSQYQMNGRFPRGDFRVKIIFFIENEASAFLIKTSACIKTLCIDRVVKQRNVWLQACLNELYRSLGEHNPQRYMHLVGVAFMLIR